MLIDLQRTFSRLSDLLDDNTGEHWGRLFDLNHGKSGWKELHDKPLIVVVGEAGIGKTMEFKNEANRLKSEGKPAFFIALNQLADSESWELALVGQETEYERWKSSSDIAYFFLDAVDEARLKGQPDFEKALLVVRKALGKCMERVHIAISSRWTDWTIEGVRSTVEAQLARPIEASLRASKPTLAPDMIDSKASLVDIKHSAATEGLEPYVVSLDPLSLTEAARFADASGVLDAKAFWDAISDGHYEFMATRPLDLRWMVDLWNERHSLGTYQELIEANISNRLSDVNPSYQAAGAVLSLDQIRIGTEQLAAATEFSSRPFISTVVMPTTKADEVSPLSVLSGWKPDEILRLLASAVFDEATYGRVKFHHRSIREYMAACWIKRQLTNGVPFHRVLQLFTSAPFDTPVLISNRRAALCWLAAIDVEAREWVTRNFPEMFLFEGDPEAWDTLSADQAFMGYIQRLKDGFKANWYNDASELRRVGRKLPPGRIAGLLADPKLPSNVKAALFAVVKHSRLWDCSDVLFRIYNNSTSTQWERRYALEILAAIARPADREQIKQDLLSGKLSSNELLASALEAIDWAGLTLKQLINVFMATTAEESYGESAMSHSIKYKMLPTTTANSAELLLMAVVKAMPRFEVGKHFAKFPASDRPERAWLLDVLPDCLERLLTLLPTTLIAYPEACLQAAERIEALSDLGFTDREDFSRLHNLISKHSALRWQIGLVVAESEDISHSTSRLTLGAASLVSFSIADMAELIARANDSASSTEVQNIWFTIGMELAFRDLRGRSRRDSLTALEAGPGSESRTSCIQQTCVQWIAGAKTRRSWKRDSLRHKREKRAINETNQLRLFADIELIRNATHERAIQWLVQYSYNHSGDRSLTRVDYAVIESAFGKDIMEALAVGLKTLWSKTQVPNPADYRDGHTPWKAIIALAGLQTLLDEPCNIASLSESETALAAKFAVWELNGPPSWFESLIHARRTAVCEALHPWVCEEAQAKTEAHSFHGALGTVLRCKRGIRAPLLQPLVPMVVERRIGHPETLKKIINALCEDALIAPSVVGDVCHMKILESIGTDGVITEIAWLHIWLEVDTVSAWSWFEKHIEGLFGNAAQQLQTFSISIADCKWIKPPVNKVSIDVLLRLHAMLTRYAQSSGVLVEYENPSSIGPPVPQLWQSIPGVLVQSRGAEAHRALMQLSEMEQDRDMKNWLVDRVREHAELEVALCARVEPGDLYSIGAAFLAEPRTEGQLHEQVLARLEEIRIGIEEGPFSDRDFFASDIPEKHLQRWLAARFLDTQNRRFSVHREEEVDDDKKTDIQLSCARGKVCIEIKPVGKTRGYSANSLVNTLRQQIVGQYLKGYNSHHGILVLFRLDSKTWNIPNGEDNQHFSALIEYLQKQANIIKTESHGIHVLKVFGINCIT